MRIAFFVNSIEDETPTFTTTALAMAALARGLLWLGAELHHRRDPGPRGERHLLGEVDEHQQRRRAVEGGDRAALHREEREVGGGERDARTR